MLFSSPNADITRHTPIEILCAIIRWADDDLSNLYNLCLVSRALLPEAQRILYQNINTSYDNYTLCSGWVIGIKKAISLLKTLTKRDSALARPPKRLYHHLVNDEYGSGTPSFAGIS